MKRILIALLVVIFGLTSCEHTTDVPIKTNILGIELCKKMSVGDVEYALGKNAQEYFYTTVEKVGSIEGYRSIAKDLSFGYGGLSWMYIDVLVNNNSEVFVISMTESYESIDSAKKQYDAAVSIFTKKYGKGNVVDDTTTWTDGISEIEISYEKAAAEDGSDRSFCYLVYRNIELSQKLREEIREDI